MKEAWPERLLSGGCVASSATHELPDLMIPYKRYAADVIEETIFQTAHLTVAADESTIYGWRKWFSTLIDYWLFILQSLPIQFEQNETPTVDLSSRLLPVHKRIGQWFGTASGWLGCEGTYLLLPFA
jgi:Domain of unknown function (DUF6431)